MQKKSGVLHFIEEQRQKGKTDTEIRHLLLDAGWQMDVIKHAMDGASHDHPVSKHTPITSSKFQQAIYNPFIVGVGSLIILVLVVIFI